MEWVESTGKTIDEAKDVALDRLGVHEDDAEFEVLSEARTGLFGRVKEDARVRARVRPTTPRAKDERRRGRGRGRRNERGRGRDGGGARDRSGSGASRDGDGRQKSGGRGRGGRRGDGGRSSGNGRSGSAARSEGQRDNGPRQEPDTTEARASRGAGESAGGSRRSSTAGGSRRSKEQPVHDDDEPTMPLTEQADLAEAFVAGLAERFGAEVAFDRTEVDDDIHLTVTGNDLGRMIGRRGSTAMAIDELVRTVLQRQAGSSRNGRIRVDIGGVRARRTEALGTFSRDLAATVRETGVAKALEPMGAADRKIVHDVITDEDGVDTISEGEDPNRRVVIVPAGDAD